WSRRPPDGRPVGSPVRLAVPDPATTPGLDPGAVAALVAATGEIVGPVDLGPYLAAGRLLYEGAFVAERYAAVGAFVEGPPADLMLVAPAGADGLLAALGGALAEPAALAELVTDRSPGRSPRRGPSGRRGGPATRRGR